MERLEYYFICGWNISGNSWFGPYASFNAADEAIKDNSFDPDWEYDNIAIVGPIAAVVIKNMV